jgi:acyl-CoA oxidase
MQPTLDVAELTRFLDGRHSDSRALVRANLAEHASVRSPGLVG